MFNRGGNVGDWRADRDVTADSALAARRADPAKAAADDAANRAKWAADDSAMLAKIAATDALKNAALAAQFGDWAIVADVLSSGPFAVHGDDLRAAVKMAQIDSATPADWMRANF